MSAPHKRRDQIKLDTDLKLLDSLREEFTCVHLKTLGSRPAREALDSLYPP